MNYPLGSSQQPDFGFSSTDPTKYLAETVKEYERILGNFNDVSGRIKDVDKKIKELKPTEMIKKFKLNRKRKRLLKEREIHKTDLDFLHPYYKAAAGTLGIQRKK